MAVDVFRHFRYTAPHETDTVIFLGFEIKVLVFAAEHTKVHIEAIDRRVREFLLDFASLLDGCHAADFRALAVAGLFIARAHAVDETDHLDGIELGCGPALEPIFQVGIGNHAFVYAVAVFFFLFGLEQVESGCQQDGTHLG